MREYPFIACSLPQLQIGMLPEISFEDFELLLELNLSDDDFKKVQMIRRYFDILNIRAFLAGEALDRHGLYNEKQLEENLVTRNGFPEYVFEYLDRHETPKEQLKYFPELLSMYYANEIKESKGFMKNFMTFERDWKRVSTALRAVKLGRNVIEELKYENLEEYELPENFEELIKIFHENSDRPMKLHQALYEYRFRMIEEICANEQFTLRKVLGYLVQFILVEKWTGLDQEKGKQFIDQVVKGIT